MTHIHILGGTGFAGSHIAHEAATRGHKVVSFTRKAPKDADNKVTYRTGDVREDTALDAAFTNADVVIVALSPRGSMDDMETFTKTIRKAAKLATTRDIRLGVIGGAGSLKVSADGPVLMDTPEFPDVIKPEATILAKVLEDLRENKDEKLDWFFVSPAAIFGAHVPGKATGHYRLGKDILVADEDGNSEISGADFALAIVDEIEKPAHHRERFTVAY
ncbi:MAG: NAD(P)H-binding protein [Micrococcaceae bacterium]